MESKKIVKHIDQLLLDPNNYRFIDRADYKPVSDENVIDDKVQQRTFNFIAGRNNDIIADLISSLTKNGLLDIDQIQVKSIGGDKYLVLEGNRRIATLKYLYRKYKEEGLYIGSLKEEDFQNISVVEIIGEDPAQHLITMGLHHISGKKRWSAVNEAQLVRDLITKYNKNEKDVCESLGISREKLRRSMRALALIEQYKTSDFGDQFKTEMYSIFDAAVRNTYIKPWLGWNENSNLAQNSDNVERFFSWISKVGGDVETDEDDENITQKEPIITQYRQITELSEFINEPKAIAKMEESRNVTEGYNYSTIVGESRLKKALYTIKNEIQIAFNNSDFMSEEDNLDVIKLVDKLERLTPKSQAFIQTTDRKVSKYFETVNSHFTSFHIESYRKLLNVEVKNIARVNLFAGGNNMGKTSILEAFYLLSQLNNINAYLELERYRGKFMEEFHAKWIDKNFTNPIELSGDFNGSKTTLSLHSEEIEEDIEKTGYLSTIIAEANTDGNFLSSSIHLYANQSPEIRYTKSQVLCQSAFTSPYRYNIQLLHAAHSQAIKEGYFEKIISFIKTKLDSSIEKIDLINDEGENRFVVTTSKLSTPLDLTKYGEGLQRVFEISLLMGYCRNGILCIDEVDSALHKTLLIAFTQFIQELAAEFNVQVFLSTHSKECIDAFVENDYPDDELTAYSLNEENGKINCKFLKGNRLKQLVDIINIDIR